MPSVTSNLLASAASVQPAAAPIRGEHSTPVLQGDHSLTSISDKLSDIVLYGPTGRWWGVAFWVSSALTVLFFGSIAYLFYKGVGIWGLNEPVVWAFDITNYVWWIAIAMSGTFISAALHLTRQAWGASISRFAEAMTIFALPLLACFRSFTLADRGSFIGWLRTRTL